MCMKFKTKIKIAICDDEEIIAYAIEKLCLAWADKNSTELLIETYDNSVVFLNALKQTVFDIILLDIDMPVFTGFDIASQLSQMSNSSLIIFVSNHESLVYESFKYKPFDFIRKSNLEKDLNISLDRGKTEVSRISHRILFKSGGNEFLIKISDILYFETQGNYLNLYTTEKIYTSRSSMKEMEQELESKSFVRIHKGFLVNINQIEVFNNSEITLKNKKILPMGRTFSENAKKKIIEYFR